MSNSRSQLNVLLVLSDQHQAACMGHEGHPQVITPNMDRLAAEGVRFSQAYTQSPICTPSRVSILSGQYCHNHGYYGNAGPRPQSLPSFLGHFRAHGYRTAGIGKLHLPDDPRNWVADDLDLYADCYRSVNGRRGESAYFDYLEQLGLRDKEDSIRLPEFPGTQQHEGRPSLLPYQHSAEGWCVAQTTQFIDSCDAEGAPFCIEISLPRPHQCYTPDRRFWEMYPDDLALPPTFHQDPSHRPPHFRQAFEWLRTYQGLIEPTGSEHVSQRVWRAYLACITQVDHSLGRLLDHLTQKGLAERTIVIYGSDHGAYSGTHGIPEKAPGICSDAVCRVPFVWRIPGLTPAGHVNQQFVENVDIAPTIVGLCGLPPMETVDGKDITPLLLGGTDSLRHVAVTEHPWSKSLRWKQWRFVAYMPEMFDGEDVGELYDIQHDVNETRNLYAEPSHQETVHKCRRLLLEWLIRNTRVTTCHPSTVAREGKGVRYPIAGDGKESNAAGPALRRKRGLLNYL